MTINVYRMVLTFQKGIPSAIYLTLCNMIKPNEYEYNMLNAEYFAAVFVRFASIKYSLGNHFFPEYSCRSIGRVDMIEMCKIIHTERESRYNAKFTQNVWYCD